MVRSDLDGAEPSERYAWAAVARNVAPFLLLIALAPLVHPWSWLLAPVIGLFIYRITIVMHDCVHRSLFTSARLNERVGRTLGALTGIDFHSFTRQHLLHHRNYGEPGDPQGFHYLGIGNMSTARFGWHLLRPLIGWNLRYTIGESVLAPRNFLRSFQTGEVLLLGLVQLMLLAIVTGGGRYPWLALLPAVSGATFGLFFSQLRGIAEHGTRERTREAAFVRSHAPHWFDRLFLYDLNFNCHREHHLNAAAPSCRLAPGGPDLGSSMLATLRMLRGQA